VIARVHPKRRERPQLEIQPAQGAVIEDQELTALLKGRVADWWIPDRIVRVEAMTLAGTGKIDKIALRARYGAA
jgi:fatty-acyl-CoA synthase